MGETIFVVIGKFPQVKGRAVRSDEMRVRRAEKETAGSDEELVILPPDAARGKSFAAELKIMEEEVSQHNSKRGCTIKRGQGEPTETLARPRGEPAGSNGDRGHPAAPLDSVGRGFGPPLTVPGGSLGTILKNGGFETPQVSVEAAERRHDAKGHGQAPGSLGLTVRDRHLKKEKKDKKRKHKKSKKGKKHRKRSSSSDSSGSGSSKDSGSSSEQVFRAAAKASRLKSQEDMLEDARENPGLLSCKSLQLMENRVGREGESRVWKPWDAPPSAKSYYLRVLLHTKPPIGTRNLREMSTICTVMDHLAMGRVGEAGDVLTQRLKAIELSSLDGDWDRARHLELVPQDSASLVNRGELKLVQKEMEAEKKVSLQPSSGQSWSSFGKGKGKSEAYAWIQPKGKGKDWQAKGKGKAKKGAKNDSPNK
jgi:hypothetical protein